MPPDDRQATPSNYLPVGSWAPDLAAFNNPGGTTIASGVVPLTGNSYGPFPDLEKIPNKVALPETPLSMYSFTDAAGVEHVFVSTEHKIYHMQAGQTAFKDVSQPGVTYTSSPFTPFVFTAHGNSIIAVNGNDRPQAYSIGYDDPNPVEGTPPGETTFIDLSEDAPVGRTVATVREFLVMGNMATTQQGIPQQFRLQWSGIGDPSAWPELGTNEAAMVQSDINDFPSESGSLMAIVANLQNADAAIIFRNAVWIMTYQGSPSIFSFRKAHTMVGTEAPRSVITYHGLAFYLSKDGFKLFDGSSGKAIGASKVDKWFRNDPIDGVHPQYREMISGVAHPTDKYVMWLYHSKLTTGTADRLLIYNFELDRWSLVRITAKLIGLAMSFGISVDELDPYTIPPNSGIENLPASTDSPMWEGGEPQLWAFDQDNVPCTFSGKNLHAVIETIELQPSFDRRSRITFARPMIDGPAGNRTGIQIGHRNRLGDPYKWDDNHTPYWYGQTPQRSEGTFIRARINIPKNTEWNHCLGVEITASPSSRR